MLRYILCLSLLAAFVVTTTGCRAEVDPDRNKAEIEVG